MAIDVNFIVDNGLWIEEDKHSWFHKLLFCPPNRPADEESPEFEAWLKGRVFSDEPVLLLPANATMLDALAQAGVFKSKSDARKNWKGPIEIPRGFSEHTIGKLQHKIWILNWVEGPWIEPIKSS